MWHLAASLRLKKSDLKEERILGEILAEVARAEQKFPDWPGNKIEQAAIVAEEAGEVVKAALNGRPCEKLEKRVCAPAEFRQELIQTAAMAIRALENLEDGK